MNLCCIFALYLKTTIKRNNQHGIALLQQFVSRFILVGRLWVVDGGFYGYMVCLCDQLSAAEFRL